MKKLGPLGAIAVGLMLAAATPSLAGNVTSCMCSFRPVQPFMDPTVQEQSLSELLTIPGNIKLSIGRKTPWSIAEGPPPDDKGTPGNRGNCNAQQCGNAQARVMNGPRTQPVVPAAQTCSAEACQTSR
jgi:hypothetical protein